MKDFLTDEEMNLLDTHGAIKSAPDFIPDEQIPVEKEKGKFQQFAEGVGKGELKTAKGLGQIGQWILDKTAGKLLPENAPIKKMGDIYRPGTEASNEANRLLEPQGGAETAGFMTERVAEFLTPTGLEAAGAKYGGLAAGALLKKGAPKFISTGAELATRGLTTGLEAGAKTVVQRGELDNEAKINTLIGAISPTVAKGVQKVGTGILNMVIKPTIQDTKNGFNIANVKKYDVGGSLSSSLEKTSSKLSDNAKQLDDLLSNSNATINIESAFKDTVSKLRDKKSLVFGKIRDVNGGIDELAQDLADMHKAMPTELGDYTSVPIKIANNQIKRGAGTKGAWVYGRIDKNAEAIDQVYSVFYNELKKQIEKNGPTAIKKLNSEMHDLIPIQSALIRRIPVADRNNVVGLGDTMAIVGSVFDPRALGVLLPVIAQKSGTVGNFLMKAADNWVGKGTSAVVKSGVSSFQDNQ